jgi:hypothetical protein
MAFIHQESKLSSVIQTMQFHSDRFPGYSQDFSRNVPGLSVAARFIGSNSPEADRSSVEVDAKDSYGQTALY